MFAIIQTGGTQYLVHEGARIDMARRPEDVGSNVVFDKVLMLGGAAPLYGRPLLEGVKVNAKVLEHRRGKKLRVVKFKRRKDYRRTNGARQDITRLEITGITNPQSAAKPTQTKETEDGT